MTYSARNLEPYRGFPTLLKAVELICQRRPHCHVIITGGDDISYSKRLPDGQNYRQLLLKTVKLPHDRVHFLGSVPYATHLQILQLSSAHVYLTYPFVLSWSFMEALACSCVVIASDTPPVMDVLQPDINGLTVNFFDYQHIADRIDQIFAHPQRMRHLGEAARQTIVQHYQHHFSINRYTRLFQQLLAPAAESHYA
jgi:glycosyltransferase involved in cell wall biosynthesis